MKQLDERDLDIHDFERQWWRYPGVKDAAIRDTFGMTSTRYWRDPRGVVQLM